MRHLAASLLCLFVVFGAACLVFARCGDDPGDAAPVAAARAQVETDCDCADATNHGDYVSCAAAVATLRASNHRDLRGRRMSRRDRVYVPPERGRAHLLVHAALAPFATSADDT